MIAVDREAEVLLTLRVRPRLGKTKTKTEGEEIINQTESGST